MEVSNRHIKLCFAVSIAFVLSLSIVALSLNASTNSHPNLDSLIAQPKQTVIAPSPDQNEWTMFGNGPSQNFFQNGTAPSTNHVLWKHWYLGLLSGGIVIDGKFIQGLSYTTPGDVASGLPLRGCSLNAYDQETGAIIWSTPLDFAMLTPFTQNGQPTKIDDQRFIISGEVFSIKNGTRFNYDLTRSISIYVPELKIGFSAGPAARNGYSTVMAWDFSDSSGPPKAMWTSDPIGMSVGCYGDGKLFVFDSYGERLGALDALTGKLLWVKNQRAWIDGAAGGGISYHNGKVFWSSLSGYLGACDANTGNEVWYFQSGSGGYSLGQPAPVGYGKVFWLSRDGWITAIDENTGGLVWKFAAMDPYGNSTQKQVVQHASQLVVADGKVYRIAIMRPTFLGGPYPVGGAYGITRFVCLDAYTGRLVWDANNWFEAWGPRLGYGKLYGSDYIYDRGLITEDYKMATGIGAWTYCIGKGPTEMSLSVDKSQIKAGETVKITGTVTDWSPASYGTPATQVPVNLTYVGPDQTRRPIANVMSDTNGKFNYQWTPWVTGALSINADSAGSNSYDAPASVNTAVVVEPSTNAVPLLEGVIAVLVVVAIVGPITVWFARKPKK